MKSRLFTVLFCCFTGVIYAQSSFVPLNEDYYHTIDRYEVKSGKVTSQLFTTVKPYRRSDIVAFIDTLQKQEIFTSKADVFNYDYFRNDSWEWSRAETSDSRKPFLKKLYRKKSDLAHVDQEAFDLHLNPVLYLGIGNDSRREDMVYINAR